MKRERQLLRRRDRAAAKELLLGDQNELLVNELIYAQFGKLASVARPLDASERKLWSSRGEGIDPDGPCPAPKTKFPATIA